MAENEWVIVRLISEQEIGNRVRELGESISHDYEGADLHLICVLKGAWVFMADLVRQMAIPVTTDFIAVSSYGAGRESSGKVTLVSDLRVPIEGKDVLLVEDIVDTGLSLQFLLDTLACQRPRSLEICALLDKPARHQVQIEPRYLGFTVPDRFIVGYGIDYDEQFRHLPYIGYIDVSP